jgi:beta-lactamase regulating signal transducer with metallopeptidase domain
MLWKSTLVSAAVVALLYAMRTQAPTSRVAVGGLGLGLLVALPCVVLALSLLPAPIIEMPASAASAVAAPAATISSFSSLASLPMSPPSEVSATAPPELILAVLWAAGAFAVLARLGAGILTLRKWTNRSALVSSPRWNASLRACNAPESTLLLVSDDVSAPLSWGWRMPMILVSRDTLANPAEGEAVIAHEAAHLARGDWPRLIAARIVVAVFWFNPFVWLIERLYLQDIEEAADAEATRRVEPANYAQALLNVARNAAIPAGANSIASGALAKRIKQVLSGRPRSRWERTWRIGALTSVAVVAAPVAVVQFVAPAASAAAAEIAPVALPAPAPRVAQVAAVVAPPVPVAPVAPKAASAPLAVAAAVAVQAVTSAPPPSPPGEIINRAELDRILKDAERARAEALVTARDAQAIAARAQAEARVALRDARKQMLRGADEMERAIPQMQSGAAQMRDEARKLRDPAYRQKVIAEARANQGRRINGKTIRYYDHVPTDQELIDAIPKMLEGADSMEASIPQMRKGAEQMRRSAQEQD